MKKATNENLLQNNLIVWLCALLCCALWGSAFPCIKIGYQLFEISGSDTASVILFAGCRFTFAGILTILFGSLVSKKILYPQKRAYGKVLWLCMLQTVLQYLFFYIGLAHTSGVKASIINAVNVFVALLVSSLIFRQEKLASNKIFGCIVGFAGVVLINMNGMNFEMSLTGEGFIFLSTVAYAFSSVYLKKFSVSENPVMLSGYQFVVGGVIMISAGIWMGGKITSVSIQGLLLLTYLSFVSAMAYTLWGILLKHNPVSRIAVFGFMTPVFGVILSAVLLGETTQATGLISVLSLILVCVGIYIVNCK
ncbi:MAG: DMT family transporter [Schaedlerella sp.]|nr:DMT family transporter [Schaedlerella sp.]